MSVPDRSPKTEQISLVWPVLLLSIAMAGMLVFQTTLVIRERSNLAALRATQEPTIAESVRMRQQLESLASGLARLAQDGNSTAKTIIEDLRRQGITVNPPR